MPPARLAERVRACAGNAVAPVLRPLHRSLRGRLGLGTPMGDTRTSPRVSCHPGRRASRRQVGAEDVVGWGCGAGSVRGHSSRSPRVALEALKEMGASAGRIRPFLRSCWQSHGGAHHCGLRVYGAAGGMWDLHGSCSLLGDRYHSLAPNRARFAGASVRGCPLFSSMGGTGGGHCGDTQGTMEWQGQAGRIWLPPAPNNRLHATVSASKVGQPQPFWSPEPCFVSPRWLQSSPGAGGGPGGGNWDMGGLTGAVGLCPQEERQIQGM